jgi:hypothetical protein
MGLLVRFPLERARAMPPVVNEGDGASILVLPVIRIERAAKSSSETQSKPRTKNGGKPRRRAKRPA